MNQTFVMYDNIIIHHNKVTIYTRHRHGVRYSLHISSSKVVSGQCICVLQPKQSLCGTTQIFLARKLICLGIKICKQFYTIRNNILDVKIYVLLSYNAITFTWIIPIKIWPSIMPFYLSYKILINKPVFSQHRNQYKKKSVKYRLFLTSFLHCMLNLPILCLITIIHFYAVTGRAFGLQETAHSCKNSYRVLRDPVFPGVNSKLCHFYSYNTQ